MADIQHLNMTMVDGDTVLNRDFFLAIQTKINDIIDVVNNGSGGGGGEPSYINFADSKVLQIILSNTDWSSDGIGLTLEEAAGVTALGNIFSATNIETFNELRFFTGITELSNQEFINCTSLREITLPPNATIITAGTSSSYQGGTGGCFKGCTALTTVNMPNIQRIGAFAFDGCTSLSHITLGTGLEYIGGRAFRNVANVPDLPEGLTRMDIYACYGIGNSAISLPSTIETINNNVFGNCSHLTAITVKATTPPTLGNTVFASALENIYVPSASVAAYKAASGWSSYASLISAIS